MTRARVLGVCLAAASVASMGGCNIFPPGWSFRAEDTLAELTAAFDNVTGLNVAWRSGTIAVTFDPNETLVRVTGTTWVHAATQAAADAGLNDIVITLDADPNDANALLLRFDAPTGTAPVYGADVAVTVPGGLALAIESATGAITVSGNEGTTQVDLATGDVTVNDNTGDVSVEVATGNVELQGVVGAITVGAATGDVTARSSAGDVKVSVATGDIDIQAQPAENGTVDVTAITGNAAIQVPATFAAALELIAGAAGTVSAALDDFTVTDLNATSRTVTATLNGGGGTVSASTIVGTLEFDSLGE